MESRPSRALWEVILLGVILVFMLVLSYFFDVFVPIVRFLQHHPDRIVYADEVLVGLVTICIGLTVFAWRRWQELKEETAARIRKQEELLRITATQAEVERIINKQLRSDMDQTKQEVREILCLLSSKIKRT